MRVAVIERDAPGGVCLNWGCIPSKALLNSAETMESIRGASKEHGIEVGEVTFDFKRVIARSREAADKLSKGVRFLLRKNKVDFIEANATITGPHTVAPCPGRRQTAAASRSNRGRTHPNCSRIRRTALPGNECWRRCDDQPRSARSMTICPSPLAIIGAGAIGAEFGYFYRSFGAEVTIVELEKQMLPGFDAEIAEELRKAFVKHGINVMLGHGYKSMARKAAAGT